MDQLIQDYLDGNLTESAQRDFEVRLQSDEALAREVRELQELEKSLASLGATQLAEEVSGWEADYRDRTEGAVESGPKPGRGIIFRQSWRIAAVMLVLVATALALWWVSREASVDTREIYASYYSPYEDMILVRGDTVSGEEALRVAMEAYNTGDYQAALGHFELYQTVHPDDIRPQLYLGISHMELGDFSKAESAFEQAKSDPGFLQQAMWYQALSAVKAGQLDVAQKLLREIESMDPQHYRQQDAKKILDIL